MHDRVICLNDPVNAIDPEGLWVVPFLIHVGSKVAPYVIPLTPYIPAATKVMKDVLDQSGPSVTSGIQEAYRSYKNWESSNNDKACPVNNVNPSGFSQNEIAEINKRAEMLAADMIYQQLKRESESYYMK